MKPALLLIEVTGRLIPGTDQEEGHLKVQGEPVTLIPVIRSVMQMRQDIAALFIACVVSYCDEQGMDSGDLKRMVYVKQKSKP